MKKLNKQVVEENIRLFGIEDSPNLSMRRDEQKERCINDLLVIIEKKDCLKVRAKLMELLGWEYLPMQKYSLVESLTSKAETDLLERGYIKENSNNIEGLNKDLKSIEKLAEQLLELIENRQVSNFIKLNYDYTLQGEREVGPVYRSFREANANLRDLHKNICRINKNAERKRGRPSLSNFNKYVEQMALLYNELPIEDDFSILRHGSVSEGDEKVYLPITKGHSFICRLVRDINSRLEDEGCKELYTDKNIYNACERALKNIRATRTNPDK